METTLQSGDSHNSQRHVHSSGLAGFLLYYSEGKAPLWKAFWIWGVALSWILFGLFTLLTSAVGLNWFVLTLATIVMMPYTAWILVAVWLCAFNVGNDLWGYLARFLTVVWALNIGLAAGLLLTELVIG